MVEYLGYASISAIYAGILSMNNDPKRYLTCFAVSAMWQTILTWMYNGMKVPPEEMARFLAKVYFYGGRTVLLEDK